MTTRIAILDDYQNAALGAADWDSLGSDAEIEVFNDYIEGEDAVAGALQGFDVVVGMRERTPFPKSLIDRLPDLKLLITTGMQNLSFDLGAARERGVVVSGTSMLGYPAAEHALALIFALFLTNPAPICVLDEVDAPLDDANIDRFCDLLDAMVRETQTRYLIVTHNAVTMSRMHRLFGVTMIEKGVSRLVSVDLQAAELLAAE